MTVCAFGCIVRQHSFILIVVIFTCRHPCVVNCAVTTWTTHGWQHSFCYLGQHEASVCLFGPGLLDLPIETLLQVYIPGASPV